MGAVTLAGQTSAISTAGTGSFTWPITPKPGNLAVFLWASQSTQTPTDPTGFTLQQSQTQANGSLLTRFLTRICVGTETGSVAFSSTAANKIAGCLLIYSGTHPTTPVDSFTFFNETVSGTVHTCPAATTVAAGCVTVSGVSERSSILNTDYTTSAPYTHESVANDSGTGGTIVVMGDDLSTFRQSGVAVTPSSWTGNVGATSNVSTLTVNLAPATLAEPIRLVGQAVNRAGAY